jgi:hypothetical protein
LRVKLNHAYQCPAGQGRLRITLDDHGNAVIERFAEEKKKEEIEAVGSGVNDARDFCLSISEMPQLHLSLR